MEGIIKDLEHAEKISRIFDMERANNCKKAINILKSSFIVRDWLTGEVRTFDNYDEAKENYDKTVKASLDANGREGECDVQLLALVEELNNID